jgi:hypothetical protein
MKVKTMDRVDIRSSDDCCSFVQSQCLIDRRVKFCENSYDG